LDKKLLAELQKRTGVKNFKLEDYCFDKQLVFIQDPSRFKTAVCSRRSGKTISCAADLMHTAQTQRGDVAYITLNRVTAKRIIWRELLTINKNFGIGAKIDNSELTMTLPNGNVIYVSGAKDESEIEKFRGLSLRKVYIDEVQSFRSYISALVEDIIEPALTDYYGSLCLIGTPGPVPAGYFYEASMNKSWSHHHWTMQQNPHIKIKSGKDPLEIIQELAERRGLKIADPSIQREFFGQWIRDLDALVFKFDPIRNTTLEVPTGLNYVMGIDIGWKDSDAIAVLGYDYHSKNVYLVEEFIKNKLDISQLVDQVRRLQEKYGPQKLVMDAGALGKKIQMEILQRHSIHIEAAEKQRKMEFIKLLNDDLATGKLKALPSSRFAEDCNLVVWDYDNPTHPKISDVYHSDINDAVLYAWRECQHYLSEAPKRGPVLYSEEWAAAEEQRLVDEMEKAGREDSSVMGSQEDIETLFKS
jgi:hypothetical protein